MQWKEPSQQLMIKTIGLSIFIFAFAVTLASLSSIFQLGDLNNTTITQLIIGLLLMGVGLFVVVLGFRAKDHRN